MKVTRFILKPSFSRILTIMVFVIFSITTSFSQSTLVKGVVVDSEGVSLPGVNIMIKNSTNGTSTSIDGRYALSGVNENDTIQFSYLGYKPQMIRVGHQSTIDVILQESSMELDEFQVVAFQKQKKESVIGSINTINPKELKVASSNLTTALGGRMAGIISYQTSGEPGKDNAKFFVRGVTTFGYKSDPLILIDGLEVTTEDLARIEPDNIESFSIMKDATATSLYGSRGANGVILVMTKTGKKGKIKVSARLETSISTPTKINSFLGGVDYMELYNQALRTRQPNALLYYSKDKIEGTRKGIDTQIYPNVDWYKELFNNHVQNYKANVNMTGGGDVAQYYLSVAYTNERGLLKVDNMNNFNNNINIQRYNIRANIDFTLTKTTKAAIKLYTLLDKYNGPIEDTENIFGMVMDANPVNFPKYYEKTDETQYLKHTLFGNKGNGSYPNPYAEMVKGYKDRFSATTQAQFQLEQDLGFITKGLKVRALASMNIYSINQNSRSFTPFYYGMREVETDAGINRNIYVISEGTESLNDPSTYNYTNSSMYFEAAVQYNRTFGDKHDVGGLLVGMAKDAQNTIQGTALSTLPSRNLGLSGRLTYGYDNRYFIEGNFGYNGSEKFAKAHRWGFFPSAGLCWIVSNERFYSEKLKSILSQLKLKATYGKVGNDAISDPSDRFFYLSDVSTNSGDYGFTFGTNSSNYTNGYVVNRYSNPEVGWEVATKANYGVELNLFDKVLIQCDYFTEHRRSIYMTREYIPSTMGLTANISSNIGEAKSWGVDGSVDFNWVVTRNWWLTSRFNYTFARNKYVQNGEPEYQYSYLSRIGHPINQQWGYVAERLFIDQEDVNNSPAQFGNSSVNSEYMPGDIKYVDINKDGKIDENDQVPIGYPSVPEIIYGFGISTGFKDFDFSFFFQGSGNSSFFIDPSSIAPFIDERNALQIIANNHWSENNPDPHAFWPRLSTTTISNNQKNSTWWLRDGRFLRLKSVELGYSLPTRIYKSAAIESVRIYVSGTNLFCFSKFDMWDPEMGGYGLGYPTQRVYNIGLSVTF